MTLVRLAAGGNAILLLLREEGMPAIAHFGVDRGRAPDEATVAALLTRASRINGLDVMPPSATLLPTGGLGFFGWPAISGHRNGRDFIQSFAGWTAEGDDRKATLSAGDPIARLDLAIDLAFHGSGVLAMRTRLTNRGEAAFTLDRCMAGTMLVPETAGELLGLDGMWGAEFQPVREPLSIGQFVKESRRGRTSHDRYPAIVIGPRGFSENDGEVLALHLGWSGNHTLVVDRLDDGRRLVHAGELFEPGEVILAPGECYESPVLAMTTGNGGVSSIARAFHAYVREAVLAWPRASMRPRPVTLNTWEGNYFKHEVDRLKRQADAAAALGVERFVLDDGWFGRRDDDRSSLGDWLVDPHKYPQGLGPLIGHVVNLGMEFGIWLEPEMVNPDSDLYRAHPDWVLQVAGRPLLLSRNQLVLDLTRDEVSRYLFERIDALLSAHPIACIKWDMNRDLTAAGDAAGRAAIARQTRAVYALIDLVRSAHPEVEIESCASGGGRADYGALSRTHRVWVSDCTDALERQTIQRGAAIFLPPEVMGAHVSASPNHQTHRAHSLAFRAITALPFHFGIELDPLLLSDDEAAELKAWIGHHKRLRPLFHGGVFFRLEDHDGRSIHGVVDREGSQMAVIVAQLALSRRELPPPVRLAGLRAEASYRVTILNPKPPDFIRITETQSELFAGATTASGDLIATVGLPLPGLRPQAAILLELNSLES